MHKAEVELAKACRKMMVWFPGQVRFEKHEKGFILKLHGDSEVVPTIGVIDGQIIGAQDDFDIMLDIIGYEAQVERVLFDAERKTFILDAGWSGKYWKKPETETQKTLTATEEGKRDFMVDTIGVRLPHKITALAVCFIAAVSRYKRQHFYARLKRVVIGKS